MKIRFGMGQTPLEGHKRFGYIWYEKLCSTCPFGRYKAGEWCKTGIAFFFGLRHRHFHITWDDSLDWCPFKKEEDIES